VPAEEPGSTGPGVGRRRQIDCVEIYLPKSIEFLAEIYRFLRTKVEDRWGRVVLDGFSTYEVDGVFRGEQTWEQRTLVIRLLLARSVGKPDEWLEATVQELGKEIATQVAPREEQIWICHYPLNLTVFQGMKRLIS
jgi:hypothetical protein